ncbi:GalNAc-alpha-(1-_4)-GalNAc-alpha-(1-_3)-diNAcBac-PP-undecaprenol alpha-1,4-N-acetyl-D-galactosaminyltransferase [Catalinimonas alkaloidigena]|uniref:glycosyltransferase family 4 protein n=1 Tax=Catalinimonas alkaloidigena TaxID=1075417 RepID=UPI002404B394|nr:glycosyltransferase family 4 protein [Catalinimonas alkaloidigena]MDF9801088.1 GalNAc-alpha-(1->4)-GalNAc-alpha-(1->3)-diNAcBac-PP-undecaprenol alpha-1,4-N-acetyl-D-galactosaminyltransferase [Catalinimonas alkaloidigena]
MKICFLVPSLVAGGAEHVMSNMANFWARKNYHVTIITLNHPKEPPFYPLEKGVELIQLNFLKKDKGFQKLLLFFKQWNAIRQEISRIKPNVLIAFLDITILLALTVRPFIQAKVIVSERNNPYLNETNPLLKKINHFLYRFCDQLVLQTNQIAHSFPNHLQSKIRIIPNPVLSPPDKIQHKEQEHLTHTIVSIGRLKWQKGYDILIKAFAPLGKIHKAWSLVIIGEGDERSHLESLSEQEGVMKQVRLVGRKQNPHHILKKASIFVLSSRFEGFPNALCEAMATGLPCIATRCQFGPEEIIEHEVNGLLVKVNDEIALRNALKLLMESAALRKKLGENALEISEQFALTKIMNRWEHLIENT